MEESIFIFKNLDYFCISNFYETYYNNIELFPDNINTIVEHLNNMCLTFWNLMQPTLTTKNILWSFYHNKILSEEVSLENKQKLNQVIQDKLDCISILSYSTGGGFIEAYFSNWLAKYHNKKCNILYIDPVTTNEQLEKYNVFNKCINLMDYFLKNIHILTIIDKCILEKNKNLFLLLLLKQEIIQLDIDILIAINPQNYLYNDAMEINNKTQLLHFLKFTRLMINIKLFIKNEYSSGQRIENVINSPIFWLFMREEEFDLFNIIDRVQIILIEKKYYNTLNKLFNILNIPVAISFYSSKKSETAYKIKYLKYKNKYQKLKLLFNM